MVYQERNASADFIRGRRRPSSLVLGRRQLVKIYGSLLSQHGFVEQRNTSDPIGNGIISRREGGCLYRIKIGRYHSSAVHQQRQHQQQRAIVPQVDSRCMSSVTIVCLPLPLPRPHSLYNPAFSSSLFLFLSPCHILFRVLFSLNSGKHRAHRGEGITGVAGREKETCTHEVSRRTGIRRRERQVDTRSKMRRGSWNSGDS